MLLNCIVLTLLYFISCAVTQGCSSNKDIFKNVNTGIYTEKNGKTLLVLPPANLEIAKKIEVINQTIPIICSGFLRNLPKLEKLMLKADKITDIQAAAFENVPLLRDMEITHNKIKIIRRGVFNRLLIKNLQLQHNQIESIESGAFDNMPELCTLKLSRNSISKIDPAWFSGSSKMQHLRMTCNDLTSIPEKAFRNMGANAVEIALAENEITFIHPKAFDGIKVIEELDLRDNRIAKLDDTLFANVREFKDLSITKNKLTCVSDKFLKNLRVKHAEFGDNPWECNKCIQKVLKWLGEKRHDDGFMKLSMLDCVIEKARKVSKETKV